MFIRLATEAHYRTYSKNSLGQLLVSAYLVLGPLWQISNSISHISIVCKTNNQAIWPHCYAIKAKASSTYVN